MKNIIFCLFIFSASCAPKISSQTQFPNPFQFENIDTAKGSKNDLFVKANEWVAKTYMSAKDVIQMHDKEAGKIIAKGSIATHINNILAIVTVYVNYTLSIDTKDGRYKYSFSDFTAEDWVGDKHSYQINASLNLQNHPQYLTNSQWLDLKNQVYDQIIELKLNLKESMHSSSSAW